MEQGPTVLTVGADGVGRTFVLFVLSYLISFSLSLEDGLIYTKILSKRAVNSRTTNQPTYKTLEPMLNSVTFTLFSSSIQ